MSRPHHKTIAKTHEKEIAAYRAFYDEHAADPAFEECVFYDLALGFFIALGVVGDSGTGESFHDARFLARTYAG